MQRAWLPIVVAVLLFNTVNLFADNDRPPRIVTVMPVVIVPEGEKAPTQDQLSRFMSHIEWSQRRFREMLRGRDTFPLAKVSLEIINAKHPISFYRPLPEGGCPQFTSELLDHFGLSRFDCPYIFVILVMNSAEEFPWGGGRPLNGGINRGGGIVFLSSYLLDKKPHFQSTLQHELGHSFGLVHVNVYGYDQKNNDSIMSYNAAHLTRGFNPSKSPGVLIPEDIRSLALNGKVFTKLRFQPSQDVPPGYAIAPVKFIGPMEILPGQRSYNILVSTASGETYGSKARNIAFSPTKGVITKFDPATMWHSERTDTGWVSIEITFPLPVELTAVSVHSQHSGKYHEAKALRTEAKVGDLFREVAERELTSVDQTVSFPSTKAETWRFSFKAGPSGYVAIRGLRYFSDGEEIFPPAIPSLSE